MLRLRLESMKWLMPVLVIVSAVAHFQTDCWAGSVRGRVVDSDGQPVVDASVELHVWEWKWPKPPRTMESDSAGAFQFDDLKPGAYRVLTQVSGCVLAMQHVILDDESEVKDLSLHVFPATQARMKIVGPEGQPLRGARLTDLTMVVAGNGKHWIGMKDFDRFHIPRCESDAAGILTLPSLANGTVASITVDHPDFAPSELANFSVQASELSQISLPKGVAVRIELVPSADLGRSIEGMEFCVQMDQALEEHRSSLKTVLFKAREGAIEFRVVPGQYGVLDVRAINAFVTPTFQARSDLLIEPERRKEVKMLVRPAIAVSGRLVTADKEVSVSSPRVWGETQNLRPDGTVVGSPPFGGWADCKWGDTNEQGEFVLYLPPGKALLQVDGQGLATERAYYEIDVESGLVSRIPDIVVGRPPVIIGRVIDQNGDACPGVIVRLARIGGLTTRSDDRGQFEFKLPRAPLNWKTGERESRLRMVAYLPGDCRAGEGAALLEGLTQAAPLVIKLEEHPPEWVMTTLQTAMQRPSSPFTAENAAGAGSEKSMELRRTAPELDCLEWLNVKGGEKSLADFRGKYVLLDFWTTWCGACHDDFPNIRLMQELFGDRLVVIGVHDNSVPVEQIRHHVQKLGLSFPIAIDQEEGPTLKAYEKLGVDGYPSYVLIDPDGKMIGSNERLGPNLRLFKLELIRQFLLQAKPK